ncbi:MAG TPA: hypothetical protein VG055_11240 [Planctomycetaceae bacterium]|jgi:hypothetical protein|nr:hypothetical protein [Planctomycetaceae bacterium]
MIIAEYADVGPGIAFLLLIGLSVVGVGVLYLRLVECPERLRHPKLWMLAAGSLQALAVYWWESSNFDTVDRSTLKRVCLGSLLLASASLGVGACWRAKR